MTALAVIAQGVHATALQLQFDHGLPARRWAPNTPSTPRLGLVGHRGSSVHSLTFVRAHEHTRPLLGMCCNGG